MKISPQVKRLLSLAQAQTVNAPVTMLSMPSKTVLNSISRFGDAFACVIVDEAHMTTPTIKQIIAHIASKTRCLESSA